MIRMLSFCIIVFFIAGCFNVGFHPPGYVHDPDITDPSIPVMSQSVSSSLQTEIQRLLDKTEIYLDDLLRIAERIQDMSLRGSYGRNTEDGENIFEVGIGLPLPLFNRNHGRIAGPITINETPRGT